MSIKADWIFIHKPLEMDLYQDSTYIMYLYSYIYCSDSYVAIYTAQISKTKCDLLKLLFNVSAKLFAEKTNLCNFLCAGFRIKNQSGQSTMTLTMMRMMMMQIQFMMMTP